MIGRNLLPTLIPTVHFNAALYGNMVGGLDLTVMYANNAVIAWNTITVGEFLAKCQRKWDLQSGMYQRFVEGRVN